MPSGDATCCSPAWIRSTLVPSDPSAAPPAAAIFIWSPATWLANSCTPAASWALCETIRRLTIVYLYSYRTGGLNEEGRMVTCAGFSQFFLLHSQFLLDPIERPRNSFLPHRILLLAGAGVHLGFPGVIDLPVLAQI